MPGLNASCVAILLCQRCVIAGLIRGLPGNKLTVNLDSCFWRRRLLAVSFLYSWPLGGRALIFKPLKTEKKNNWLNLCLLIFLHMSLTNFFCICHGSDILVSYKNKCAVLDK